MQAISDIIQNLSDAMPCDHDEDEYVKKQIEWANSKEGFLSGYDCVECKNRGFVAIYKDGYLASCTCVCVNIRSSLKKLEKSGIAPLAERYTFEKFLTPEPWQAYLKEKAHKFSDNATSGCLLLLGMTGAGKTHLATAVTVKLILQGIPATYAVWCEFSKRIKSLVTEADIYEKELHHLRSIDVLYIDDLFKSGSKPTAADISLFFEIINARYNARLTTIISSEYMLDQLKEIDEAIAGRLFEWAGEFTVNISYDKSKNYRFR